MDSKIAQYAKEHLGITPTEFQMEIIRDVAAGKPIGQLPPRAGLTTANRIMRAYLTDGLEPLPESAARKYWHAYQASLQPQVQQRYPYPRPGAQCPNCHREINGVNPYDDGQTWRINN